MSRPHRWAGASLAVAVLLVGVPGPTTSAAPNPYGRRSAETTITLQADGGYDVTLRQAQELNREYAITFGGGVHDGFRLPDDGGPLPPYLRADYALTAVAVAEGRPRPADFTRTHHRVAVTSTGTYPAGRHESEIRYRVTGAAQPTARGWTVHVRLLGIGYPPGARVTIDAAPIRPTRLRLRCVTYPPDSRPCGSSDGSTLVHPLGEDPSAQPPEFAIEVEADNATVPEPTIDRH